MNVIDALMAVEEPDAINLEQLKLSIEEKLNTDKIGLWDTVVCQGVEAEWPSWSLEISISID